MLTESLNKGTEQPQETERTSDVFQTVLTNVNLKSELFFVFFLFVFEVKKIRFIKQLVSFKPERSEVPRVAMLNFTKLQYVFLLLSLQGHYRVTDED